MNNNVEAREEERIRALETRMTTWLRVAIVQQVVLVGLIACAYVALHANITASHTQDDA
eukprot:CAMPEP_0174751684 /NCGR_PEP_ID=MMETSP1094-20130205/100360_1 /TAXON_ID=156173 /ORGANISM="Chrysochromulina brevifilum, Strain UTEX LB 985" /LENGTH=58 /DNA_ID=CAMNT_0015957209 /DNA_START=219 /DNA_END=391 /DNA_ORIENTATION=-